jgi:L-asparaginase
VKRTRSIWIQLVSLAAVSGLLAAPTTLSAQAAEEALPRVVVLATGGTIASMYDPDIGALRAALSGEEIVQAVPGLAEVARVEVEQIATVGSRDMTPEIWVRLSRRVNELLASPDVTGVVVTHGTDTLEETAYFLDLTVTSDKPVVMVGAQRAPVYFDSDGSRNMLDAVRVAISPEAVGMGTTVVMNGRIEAAREVTKTSTLNVETFQTREFGSLGVADLGAVRFYRAPLRRQTIPVPPDAVLPRVEIVSMYAGADGRVIDALLDTGELDGLVIAGLGLAHIPEAAMASVHRVREAGIPVVLSTRVQSGRILPLYANNVELLDIGAVEADNLSPQKARVLLMAAMVHTSEVDGLRAYFGR